MIDAEYIDHMPNTDGFDIIAVYGSAFGSHQGPGRPTPAAYIHSVRKPLWCIYFPGASAGAALAEAHSYAACVGVVMDLESQWELDPASRNECAKFGAYMQDNKMPCVLYCHQDKVRDLAPWYNGQWWPGMAQSTPLGTHGAVQYGYPGSYDMSVCSNWFANPAPVIPTPQPPQPPQYKEIDVLKIQRPNNAGSDSFAVLPSGVMVHSSFAPDGTPESNDHLPGSWVAVADATWMTDGTLHVRGWAIDGSLWQTIWANNVWQPDTKLAN